MVRSGGTYPMSMTSRTACPGATDDGADRRLKGTPHSDGVARFKVFPVLETVVQLRREHASGKAIKAIARDLRLSRKVVRKAIWTPEGAFDYRRTVQPLPPLGPFQERLARSCFCGGIFNLEEANRSYS